MVVELLKQALLYTLFNILSTVHYTVKKLETKHVLQVINLENLGKIIRES